MENIKPKRKRDWSKVVMYVKLCILYHSAETGEINTIVSGHFMCKLTQNPEHFWYVGPNEALLQFAQIPINIHACIKLFFFFKFLSFVPICLLDRSTMWPLSSTYFPLHHSWFYYHLTVIFFIGNMFIYIICKL